MPKRTLGQSWLPPLVAALLVGASVLMLGQIARDHLSKALVREDMEQLAQIRGRLESELNLAANASAAVGALVEHQPDIDAETLIAVARKLRDRNPVIRSITIAPDSIIAISVPLEGNEAAIGLDLSAHPVQSASLFRAIESRRPVLGGPYPLVQGPYAVIHRVPIFVERDGKQEYWGLISTPIEVDALLARSDAAGLAARGRLAIRGLDGLGARGEVFLGDPALFKRDDVLLGSVNMLDGSWQLAFEPSPPSPLVRGVLAITLFLSILLGGAAGWLARRWQKQQRRLADSEYLLRDVTSNVRDIVFRTDIEGNLVFLSPAFERLTGRPIRQLMGQPWLSLLEPSSRKTLLPIYRDICRGDPLPPRQRLPRAGIPRDNGESLPVEVRLNAVKGKGRHCEGVVGILADLSEQQAFEQARDLAASVFEATGDAIVFVDRQRVLLAANPAFERLVGRDAASLLGEKLRIPTPTAPLGRVGWQAARVLRRLGHWRGEIESRLPNGDLRILSWTIDAIRDSTGRIAQYSAVISDATERYRMMQRMRYLALHDPLTDLLNRAGLDERFAQARSHADRQQREMALAFFDLDGFKPINDTWGHDVGDVVLREVAARLRTLLRGEDIVCRLGGDEFLIVYSELRQPDALHTLGERLMETVSRPIRIESIDREVRVGASVGFARYPIDGEDLDTLLRAADRAMYRAKTAGKGRYCIYGVDVADESDRSQRASNRSQG